MSSQLSNLTDDDLMKEIPGEVVVAGDTDANPPEAIQSYWDSPYIRLISNGNGKWSWQCHHCNCTYKGKNASKAGKHLTGFGSQHIVVCKGAMSDQWRSLYRDLAERLAERRAIASSHASQFEHLQNRHDEASLKAVQRERDGRLQSSTASRSTSNSKSPSSLDSTSQPSGQLARKPSAGIRSSNSLTTWIRNTSQPKAPPPGQMTLSDGLPNPTANAIARNKVARYLISTNKPMKDCEDLLFRSMCLSFRNVDSKFEFPTRKTLTNQYLPAHAKSRREDSYHKVRAEANVFGIAMLGDGATIKRMPLINILASSGSCPSALLQIVDCTKHMAQGGIKSAEYIAGLMTPHVENLGKDYVDLFLFDGASISKRLDDLCPLTTHELHASTQQSI